MTKIERMANSQTTLPAPRGQVDTAARSRSVEPVRSPEARATRQSRAALGRLPLGATRPVAGFLAQYVDQHWHWPYSPSRKQEKRQRAATAYIDADTLPDLLVEALRLPRLERKL